MQIKARTIVFDIEDNRLGFHSQTISRKQRALNLLSRLDHPGQFKARHSRHADIKNDESELVSEQRKHHLFSGLGPNQPVTRIVQARLENGQIFWFIVNDQDVDGRLSMQDGRRSRTRCLRRGSYVLSSPGKGAASTLSNASR